mmetsp:Transcript_29382/g.45417  ORF Transcript_29382/g.45417 Transcript_29382/m.45417 type:complete len:186 (-) Transcript_29382:31-588(-)|eukprot:CAMPEP_0201520888 /NCGR_PEP_ID=MMETSP0161_2-20130828/13092_1 /ASSEMBLY_ACC=CAM_ASM_000251 /TAXON_ID=180227 /ORGANISM="Neoparamoeba aestuarina, Strain SoJaBio B1-5/56/2" /LENGTH=185 /DNA_ID=CAMNT_0047919401 /DNA_START=39 /DNA_END=596 /DNA_ORIENTATION=+
MKTILLVLAVSVAGLLAVEKCSHPNPAPTFTYEGYEGFWYEIGKIQTKGGAYFERECVCTTINISYADTEYDGHALQQCRNYTQDGALLSADGQLIDPGPPGRWEEKLYNKVEYIVVELDTEEQVAVEYDCGSSGFRIDYCLHYMSRTPTMDPDVLSRLINQTAYLNTEQLPYKQTLQTDCPPPF